MSNFPENNNINMSPDINIVVQADYPTLTVTPSPEILIGGGGGGAGGVGNPGPPGSTGNTGAPGDLYSTTSNTTIDLDLLNLGDSLTLVVSSGLAYSKVQSILVANSVSNYFYATVSSYSGTNLNIITGAQSKEGSGTHSSWTVNLAGAVGQIGPQGSVGTTGNTGNPGTTGNTGFGTTGTTGNPGTTGTTGNTGNPGTTGNTGTSGDVYSTTSFSLINLTLYLPGDTFSFTVPSGLAYTIGQIILVSNSLSTYFYATVSSYSDTTLTVVLISSVNTGPDEGSTPWDVNLAGAVGQQGLPGAKGTTGNTGNPGTTGNTGNPGTTGNTGNPGTTGNTGNNGTKGINGINGNPGTTGNTGNPGTTGNTGNPGTTGNTGNPGTTGNTGNPGTTGNTGNPGTTGNTGNPGTTGTTGTPGDIYSTTSSTTVDLGGITIGATVNLTVSSGLAYSIGQSVLIANSVDNYFNATVSSYSSTTLSVVVVSKNGTGSLTPWAVNLAGAVGQAGEVGPRGTTGNTGNPGTTGNTGNPGTTGNTGNHGTTGNTGNPGTTGNTGNPGTTGNTGNPGTTGNTGNPGTTGNTGFGTTGTTGNAGTTGNTGNPGTTGNTGNPGTTGNTGFGTTGTTGNAGTTGNTGNPGTTGNTGFGTTGNTGNPGTTGNTGNPGTTGNTGFGTTGNTGNPGTTGTTGTPGDIYSTTSSTTVDLDAITVGTTVNLTVSSGLAYSIGQSVLIANSVSNYFNATVSSYSSTTLSVVVVTKNGSGSLTPWAVNLAGAVGQAGSAGPRGTTGNTGNPGTTGNTGNPGTTGTTGFGTTGNTGNPGTTGNTGNPGTTGNTGFGTTGNTGNPGTTGTTGNTGNPGTTGNTGNPGTTGTTGTPGDLYKTTSSTLININSLSLGGTGVITVDAGLAYTPGINVLVAVSLTVYILGNVISYSGTTLTYKIIGWAGTGSYSAWTVNILNLNGATGPEGKVGPRGTTGNTGNPGRTGTTGNTGNPGTTGNTGFGTTGNTGNPGTTGNTGNAGTTGNTGQGVIAGGTPGFYLTKDGIADYGTTWSRGAASDGSAIIYKLLPNAPQGLSAGDLISYNGATAWAPTPRTYLVTPSLWHTRKTTGASDNYPVSRPFPNEASSLTINGATSIPGELIQISLDGQDGGGNTFGSGTWWFNYSIYGGLLTSGRGGFVGSYSGLKVVDGTTFYTSDILAPRDKFTGNFDDYHPFHVAGYAILIRGTTYNALDGRGGPYGSTTCNVGNPNQRPLGSDSCYADGVAFYPIVCDANKGFTYNGVYFDCPPI
jgi:hypothetical protein